MVGEEDSQVPGESHEIRIKRYATDDAVRASRRDAIFDYDPQIVERTIILPQTEHVEAMTPLQRMAKAIEEAIFADDQGSLDYFGDIARAALNAIREPSEGMLVSGARAHKEQDRREDDTARPSWQAMIDAALAEGE